MNNQDFAFDEIRGTRINQYGGSVDWHVDDDVLHVVHTSSDCTVTRRYYRLTRVEQKWVEVQGDGE